MLRGLILFFFGLDVWAPQVPVLSPLDRFFPCAPGLTVKYQMLRDGREIGEVTESVEGLGAEPRTCVLARTTRSGESVQHERWAREHLADRIADAGPVDLPTAFRPPMLKAPVQQGNRWHFNRVDFSIAGVDERAKVPAGTFLGVIRVLQHPTDGKGVPDSIAEYAPGVGLIRLRRGPIEIRAVAVIGAVSP